MGEISVFRGITKETQKKNYIIYDQEVPLKRRYGAPKSEVDKDYKTFADRIYSSNIAVQYLDVFEDGSQEAIAAADIESRIELLKDRANKTGSKYIAETIKYINALKKIAETNPSEYGKRKAKLAGLMNFFATTEGDAFKLEVTTLTPETEPSVSMDINAVLELVLNDEGFSFGNERGAEMISSWRKIGLDSVLETRRKITRNRDDQK